MNAKRIINCAVTGSIHTPTMSPYLPITPDQIAAEAVAAAEAGAATLHIHVRDPENGQPVSELGLFREVCQKVHAQTQSVICLTTGGGLGMTPQERLGVVKALRPELASLNMGSMNYGLFQSKEKYKSFKFEWEEKYLEMTRDFVYRNTFYELEYFLSTMRDCGTKPEMECYDVGQLYNAAHFVDRGLVEPPFWLQYVMGVMGGIQPSVENILHMKSVADKLFGRDYFWSVLAVGRHEFSLCTVSAVIGGHVRIGLEDNLYLGKGELAKSNGDMVAKMARILNELSLEVASPDDARQMLGLKGRSLTNFG